MTENHIKNKVKRKQLALKEKKEKIKAKHKIRHERSKIEKLEPEKKIKRLENNIPDTIENKRVYDESIKTPMEDEEELFSDYFNGNPPNVLITTSKHAKKEAHKLAEMLVEIFPKSKYVQRGWRFSMKEIAKFASNRNYTDLVVLNEDKKKVNGITFIHLPNGPTMYFTLTSLKFPKEIHNHGTSTGHIPELILNQFTTHLGRTVGRMFQSLFPHHPEFIGRQVITLHNQRDFIFFRRHRYIFKNEEKVGLQELGPQFTLKLRRIHNGIHEEIEWVHTPRMDKDKRKFYL